MRPGGGAAERGAARARGRRPQRKDERLGAGAGRVLRRYKRVGSYNSEEEPETASNGGRGEVTTVELREMDEHTTYMQQLQQDTGPVVLINQFNVAAEDVERLVEVWTEDARFMQQQPGFI